MKNTIISVALTVMFALLFFKGALMFIDGYQEDSINDLKRMEAKRDDFNRLYKHYREMTPEQRDSAIQVYKLMRGY